MRFARIENLTDALYEPLCCLSINQRRIKALASRFDDRSPVVNYQRRSNLLNPTAVCEWNREFVRIILRRTSWQQVPHSPRPLRRHLLATKISE